MWEELHRKRRCGCGGYGNSSRFVLMPLHCFRFCRRVDREMILVKAVSVNRRLLVDFVGY